MTNFNTDFIWRELSVSGKIIVSSVFAADYSTYVSNLPYDRLRELLAKQLYSEAKDEGVSIRVDRARSCDDILYVYLRKVN